MNQYSISETAQSYISTSYHELGHASHYTNVGETYWMDYRDHIVFNGGYGSFGNFNFGSSPGKVALGQAVGNYIGYRYGSAISGSPGAPLYGGEINHFRQNFIPVGLMWDLEDSQQDYVQDPNNSLIFLTNENVFGFTSEQYFDALNVTIVDIELFGQRLKQLHLNNTPNSGNDYDNLLEVYDVFN